MKTTILLLILTTSIICKSQCRIGSTVEEIKKEFFDKTMKYGIDEEKGTPFLFVSLSHGIFVYLFDKNQICYRCAQYPNTPEDLNFLIASYNKEYIVVSKTDWDSVQKNGKIMLIHLDYKEETKMYSFFYDIAD